MSGVIITPDKVYLEGVMGALVERFPIHLELRDKWSHGGPDETKSGHHRQCYF